MCLFLTPLEYLIKKKNPYTHKVSGSLIKVKSCNALLHVPLVFIQIYLKSVLMYKFLNFTLFILCIGNN